MIETSSDTPDWKSTLSTMDKEYSAIDREIEEALSTSYKDVSKVLNMTVDRRSKMSIQLHPMNVEAEKDVSKAKILDTFLRQHDYAILYYGASTVGIYKLSKIKEEDRESFKDQYIPVDHYWILSKRDLILLVSILKEARDVKLSLTQKAATFSEEDILKTIEPIIASLEDRYKEWWDGGIGKGIYSLTYATYRIKELASFLKKQVKKG